MIKDKGYGIQEKLQAMEDHGLIRTVIIISLLGILLSMIGSAMEDSSKMGVPASFIKAVHVGNEPEGITINPDTGMVYVVNENETEPGGEIENDNESDDASAAQTSDGGILTVFDRRANKVVAKINISSDSEYLAANPSTNKIYISNRPAHELTVVDGRKNKIIATIPIKNEKGMPEEPEGIAIDTRQNIIYVGVKAPEAPQACEGSEECDEETPQLGHIYVIDGDNNKIIKSIPAGDDPESTVFNPTVNKVYTANEDDRTVTVARAVHRTGHGFKGGEILAAVTPFSNVCQDAPLGTELDEYGEADKMAVNPDTNKVYITDDQHRVAVIDGGSDKVRDVLTITYPSNNWNCSLGEEGPNLANNIVVNPYQNLIYVTSEDSRVAVIDGKTFKIQSNITVPDAIHLDAIALNPDLNLIYITDEESGSLNILQGDIHERGHRQGVMRESEQAANWVRAEINQN